MGGQGEKGGQPREEGESLERLTSLGKEQRTEKLEVPLGRYQIKKNHCSVPPTPYPQ